MSSSADTAMEDESRPLVICYGNRLRSDDGVAWHIADRLTGDRRLAGAGILCCHQLTPELVLEVSGASRVAFVDASLGEAPGTVGRQPVITTETPSVTLNWSHGLTPAALAGLSAALYGRVPPMEVVTVTAGSFGALGRRRSKV